MTEAVEKLRPSLESLTVQERNAVIELLEELDTADAACTEAEHWEA